jgi:hypothetical protein
MSEEAAHEDAHHAACKPPIPSIPHLIINHRRLRISELGVPELTATALGEAFGVKGQIIHRIGHCKSVGIRKKNTIHSRNAVIPFQPHNILRSMQPNQPDQIESALSQSIPKMSRAATMQLVAPRFGSVRLSSVSVRGHLGDQATLGQTKENMSCIGQHWFPRGRGPERQSQRQAMPQTGPGFCFLLVLGSASPPCMEALEGFLG